MIKLPKGTTFNRDCYAVVYPIGMEVSKPRFYVAKKREQVGRSNRKSGAPVSTKWNGYGGRWVPSDHSIFSTAVRELREKSGVRILQRNLKLCGIVEIVQPTAVPRETVSKTVYFFKAFASDYSDYPKATVKMGEPKSFSVYDAPWEEMRPADELILPILMRGQTVRGSIRLTRKGQKLVVSRKSLRSAYM